jgi:hypothetical protein
VTKLLQEIIGYAAGIFIFSPINLFIHELGHAFFIKVFGGKMKCIYVGSGEPILKIQKVVINKYFFLFGLADYEDHSIKITNKLSYFLIAIGGVLFNAITLTIVILVFNAYDPNHFLKGYYIGFTAMLILSAIIPITYPDGNESDGKYIMNLLKNKA